ncbi:hypothetical protein B0H10DRAFT_1964911 [Mycena sp. CBHHK59/15]|nr:hypothetical protein B0H10DRAFT_1964911 [Mycena sp. CBHHK59/15]
MNIGGLRWRGRRGSKDIKDGINKTLTIGTFQARYIAPNARHIGLKPGTFAETVLCLCKCSAHRWDTNVPAFELCRACLVMAPKFIVLEVQAGISTRDQSQESVIGNVGDHSGLLPGELPRGAGKQANTHASVGKSCPPPSDVRPGRRPTTTVRTSPVLAHSIEPLRRVLESGMWFYQRGDNEFNVCRPVVYPKGFGSTDLEGFSRFAILCRNSILSLPSQIVIVTTFAMHLFNHPNAILRTLFERKNSIPHDRVPELGCHEGLCSRLINHLLGNPAEFGTALPTTIDSSWFVVVRVVESTHASPASFGLPVLEILSAPRPVRLRGSRGLVPVTLVGK